METPFITTTGEKAAGPSAPAPQAAGSTKAKPARSGKKSKEELPLGVAVEIMTASILQAEQAGLDVRYIDNYIFEGVESVAFILVGTRRVDQHLVPAVPGPGSLVPESEAPYEPAD